MKLVNSVQQATDVFRRPSRADMALKRAHQENAELHSLKRGFRVDRGSSPEGAQILINQARDLAEAEYRKVAAASDSPSIVKAMMSPQTFTPKPPRRANGGGFIIARDLRPIGGSGGTTPDQAMTLAKAQQLQKRLAADYLERDRSVFVGESGPSQGPDRIDLSGGNMRGPHGGVDDELRRNRNLVASPWDRPKIDNRNRVAHQYFDRGGSRSAPDFEGQYSVTDGVGFGGGAVATKAAHALRAIDASSKRALNPVFQFVTKGNTDPQAVDRLRSQLRLRINISGDTGIEPTVIGTLDADGADLDAIREQLDSRYDLTGTSGRDNGEIVDDLRYDADREMTRHQTASGSRLDVGAYGAPNPTQPASPRRNSMVGNDSMPVDSPSPLAGVNPKNRSIKSAGTVRNFLAR